jgi:hypothetical protein
MILNFLKKYWLEIIVFGAITAVLGMDMATNMTWMNTDSDGIHYVYSAKYLYPSHKQGAPLYTLLGHLFLYIPIGTDFFRMALISVLSGIIGSVLIYLIIKVKTRSKWYGVVGALVYGGSALAISQNTIVEAYPIVVTACLAVYYFAIRKKWLTASIFTGVALALHPTALIVLIPMIIGFKELRKWKRLAVILPFFLFYLYVPITNRPPYMWQESNHEGGVFGYVKDAILTVKLLVGGLAIWDLPKRILDTGGLILLNFTIGLVPLVVCFVKREKGKKWYKNLLLWTILVPVIFFISNLAPQTYVYLQPAIAFGAIAIGVGLSKMKKQWLWATLGCAVVMLGFNGWYFDIGTRLDPNLSATKYYTVELDKVPDNQILMPYYGWEWAAIYSYNKNNDRNIIPICIDTLVSPEYQKILTEQGIKFDDNLSDSRVDRQNHLALSVVQLNENVWTTRVTDAETYGCEVIPAKGNEQYLIKVPTEPPAQWHWKPSNPLRIIDGSLEINDWKFITLSNYNIIFFFVWGGGFIYLYWLALKFWEKQDKKKKAKAADGKV